MYEGTGICTCTSTSTVQRKEEHSLKLINKYPELMHLPFKDSLLLTNGSILYNRKSPGQYQTYHKYAQDVYTCTTYRVLGQVLVQVLNLLLQQRVRYCTGIERQLEDFLCKECTREIPLTCFEEEVILLKTKIGKEGKKNAFGINLFYFDTLMPTTWCSLPYE